MIEIQIEKEKYKIPTEWKDITLEYWCGMFNIIKKYTDTPKEGEEKEKEEPKVDEVKILRMNREIFKYITGLNDIMLNKLDFTVVVSTLIYIILLFVSSSVIYNYFEKPFLSIRPKIK